MYRYIIEDKRHVPPFNEAASELTIGTEPLKIHQEHLFNEALGLHTELRGAYDSREHSVDEVLRQVQGEAIVYRDNLWFDKEFVDAFLNGYEYYEDGKRRFEPGAISLAKKHKCACRAAFFADDRAFRTYTLPLAKSFTRARLDMPAGGETLTPKPIFLADLWYFPDGYVEKTMPVMVRSEAKEKGYYTVPDFMTLEQGDLTHYLSEQAIISVESWVHIFFASIIHGVFSRGSRFEEYVKRHNFYSLKLLWRAVMEQKQVLMSSEVVKVGKGTVIDPSAIITGPTTIGENCFIGPGVVIDNCAIGNNVNIAQGCQLMLSTVADNCFLPFRAALFMTAVMNNTIIAQNTCLQMGVIGRNSFIGAGSTFTDFNLVGKKPIRAATIEGGIEDVGQIVLGSAVGHNCRIGSGMVVFPGRMIESDVVLFASSQRRVISRNVTFEESDHHYVKGGEDVHQRFFPRHDEIEEYQGDW